jgi:hypothetical protein
MGWDRDRYYTRSRKVRGKVVRDYYGSGPVAHIAAQAFDLLRRKRQALLAHRRQQRAELLELQVQVGQVDRIAEQAARAELEAAGYHQHHQGEWRRRRAVSEKTQVASQEATISQGRRLAHFAERMLLDKAAFEEPAYRQALESQVEHMRAELLGTDPTPAERLLVDRVVCDWLHVQHLECRLAVNMNSDDLQRAFDRAHRRYLAALRSLERVRLLALPVLRMKPVQQQEKTVGLQVAAPIG